MSHIKSLINNLINDRSAEAELDLHNHILSVVRGSLHESADAVAKKVENLLNQVQRRGVNSLLTQDELESGRSVSDESTTSQIVKFFLSKRVDGISDLAVERVTGDDDLPGAKFTFKVGGKNYSGSWYPDAGAIVCYPLNESKDKPFVPALLQWSKRDFNACEIAGLIVNAMSNSNDIRPVASEEKVRKALNFGDKNTPGNLVITGFYSESDAQEWLKIVMNRLHERDEDIDPEYSGVTITTDFDKSYLND